MEPGVYFSISNEDYHRGAGISKSQLDDVAISMAVYQWRKDAPEDDEKKEPLIMGTALHCALLEPDQFSSRFVCSPEFNRRTNDGKKEEQHFLADMRNQGKSVLSQENWRKLSLMRDSTFAHPSAKWLLNQDGHCEASMYWNDNDTGVLCRCRPDKFLNSMPVIIDVKKVSEITRFPRHIAEFRYHVQDAFYREGFKQNYGETPMFVFIVVSESIECGRYPVRVYSLTPYDVEVGTHLFRSDLTRFAKAIETNDFGGIEEISRPEWDKRSDFL
ncbi:MULTISPECIES: PD-(D/E)XK nuclease-like domain-containing protein [Pantoea]|uniref:Exodeoxyribonuclease VIII n=1 Tax=Candidatus Pantoea floridensis TaxID=1938870 RepID=A0A286C018_9GAMM|nr:MULTISPECIES: PD-(D/E)XK nuclease-like domain-containing protein [Pantoea]PIF22229.1 exodeoxyribonuclease VIII [Enterobacteriaceae bacterium JKS000233]PXW18489.1 exodeoxyribonuclease VIII [Pantoea sp. JKS000250]SOD39736.1 exodeoxyribonuclease VIII [Pantoea floridensis]